MNLIGDFGDSVDGPTPVAVRVIGTLAGKAPGAHRWTAIRHLAKAKVDRSPAALTSSMPGRSCPRSTAGTRTAAPSGTLFVRVMWSNGLTACPTGAPVISSYRALYRLPGGGTMATRPLEVADLHDHETSFNADNMHDLCLPQPPRGAILAGVTIGPQPPRGAILAGVTIGADRIQDPDGDPNEAQRFKVTERG